MNNNISSYAKDSLSGLKIAPLRAVEQFCKKEAEHYRIIPMERQPASTSRYRPACVGSEEAVALFGWPNYYLPFLMRAGHLKPLGKPAQNARKWFATVEIERLSCDTEWLDKAIRIVEKQIQEMNRKQRGKEHSEMSRAQ